jgi:hypothetical protein
MAEEALYVQVWQQVIFVVLTFVQAYAVEALI